MRKQSLAVALVVALILTGCDGGKGPDDDPSQPASTQLTTWSANLEHLLPEHNWRSFIDRAAPQRPNLLFLTELTRPETQTVVDALGEETGSEYAFEHAPVGNNAVVWAAERFGQASPDDPLLWEPFGADRCSRPSTSDPSQVIGVRLNDRQSESDVIAVTVHWGRTWAAECMEKNMAALNEMLEGRWPGRALTVVAGDLNAHPDKQPVPGDPDAETLESGRETDPDCWYRAFSVLDEQTLESPRPEEDDRDCSNDPHYSESADSYVDAVAAVNEGDDLCDQWTSVHGAPVTEGTSCTDLNKDGLRDRGRIDYVWVRWEDAEGDAVVIDAGLADELIAGAAADQVCILDSCAATRYSDHRGVWAELSVKAP